ncbi:MAG TPA: SxtJ family membrane protein [Bacteroidales bacterium]|nr:SxtJ family membrane protein [Bacteroidales bacterium]HRZ49357.1 SxtJ family membrane protein [Bacteroidales bacterium]
MEGKRLFRTRFDKTQHRDAGLALVLVLLLVGIFSGHPQWYLPSFILLVLAMTIPMVFYPFSVFWYAFSDVMGHVMSAVILTLLFSLLIVPTALLRRMAGKDALRLKLFGKQADTAFIHRDITFAKSDIEHPY